MDERSRYEKLSIRESARSLKRYGSTNKHTIRENYIKHIISPGDTLQGIALKYGVTMEQIRRANRLWTSDSLFLREHLLIPETENNSIYEKSDNLNNILPTSTPTSPDLYENTNDFLGKIDAAIATTKEDLKRVQKNSKISQDINGYGISNESSSDKRNTIAPTRTVVAQDHKIRTSMKRHEWQQEELFEL
ncbi:lysM and putative peptidoglycan-binding domain-containing protein 2 [Onthophagus taurus]|uniref:lysM and putative peptidoglycan-binding domain-containing protein 2 n=1 Tax=Onthophagus taurus TaxID=166361 RepID=UPI000C207053|nr:lysM and putative peptidoglycan-binding domain-containing protein 2 [Onthophagus taurus]XP_022920084.1 lysM and putative peptidoglycan-binding domain-containing protein 2 [Onthophagus taurus]